MRLEYLVGASPAGGEGTGLGPASPVPAIATALVRETILLELPPLPPKDAEAAAIFKAAGQYPGNAADILVSVRIFSSKTGKVALAAILPRSATMVDGEGSPVCPILAPQDCYRPGPGESRLDLFLSADWLEWLATEHGTPLRLGSIRLSENETSPLEMLREEFPRHQPVYVWVPQSGLPRLAGLAGRLGLSFPDLIVGSYEDSAEGILAHGGNSFGPRKNPAKRRRVLALSLLACIDLSLLCAVLLWAPLQAQSELRALRQERRQLGAAVSEAVAARKRIAELEASRIQGGAQTPSSYAVIDELCRTLPQETMLTGLDIQARHFRLVGSTRNAFDLLAQLKGNAMLEGLGMEQSPQAEGEARYRFVISGSLGHD